MPKKVSARSKRADQQRYSKAEMKARRETTLVQKAVKRAEETFALVFKAGAGEEALKRLKFIAKTRKMTPAQYAAKVLLKK